MVILYDYDFHQSEKHHMKYAKVTYPPTRRPGIVDTLQAMKMAARLQTADPKGKPILLLVQKKFGHGGGIQLPALIEQQADIQAFLLDAVGLKPKGMRSTRREKTGRSGT